jgi:hypothetical protein
MKVQCYAIFDSCSGVYEKAFFSTADDLVKREFQDVATAADHLISKHPEHFSLWRLGVFNNENGDIQNERNECLWTATEAIGQAQVVDPGQMDLLEKKVNGDDPYDKLITQAE